MMSATQADRLPFGPLVALMVRTDERLTAVIENPRQAQCCRQQPVLVF